MVGIIQVSPVQRAVNLVPQYLSRCWGFSFGAAKWVIVSLKCARYVRHSIQESNARIREIGTSEMKPITWLLDVDGVINASRPGWSKAPLSGNAYADGYSYRMRWSSDLIGRIRAVHDTGFVNILWATTWVGHTDQLEKLFRLPAFNSARSQSMATPYKRMAAEDVVDSGRKLIWTDDEAIPTAGAVHFKLVAHGSLLIAPKPSRGLRPEHLDEIDRYVVEYGP